MPGQDRILPALLRMSSIANKAAGMAPASGRATQIVNIGMLLAGLLLGQGSIFAAQTALVAAGDYELLAAFGTHYSFAIFGIILVDAGGSTTLAQLIARKSTEPMSRREIWRIFHETSVVRLATAVLIGAMATAYVLMFSADPFSRWYVALAFPGLLLWTINGIGLLDGLRLSGISGLTGSAAYFVTALGLLLARHRSSEMAGAILGGAFSIGYLATVTAQWIALRTRGWSPQLGRITLAGLAKALKDGGALTLQLVPGQLNMRLQLVLSTFYLGAETTALFIYAKQITAAATQIIGFVLRVEFPGLVQRLSVQTRHGVVSILSGQKMALYCAFTIAAGISVVAAGAAAIPHFGWHQAAVTIAAFAPTILTLSLSMMMMQGLAALGAYAVGARTVAAGSAIGIVVSYILVFTLGVYAFVLGEIVFNLTAFYLVYRHLRRRP